MTTTVGYCYSNGDTGGCRYHFILCDVYKENERMDRTIDRSIDCIKQNKKVNVSRLDNTPGAVLIHSTDPAAIPTAFVNNNNNVRLFIKTVSILISTLIYLSRTNIVPMV